VAWREVALRRIRHRLRGARATPPPWFDRLEEDRRARLRLFGRHLLDLASHYVSRRGRRARLLEEARLVGEGYGEEMARHRVPLPQAVEAFLFFRNAALEAVIGGSPHPEEVRHLHQQVMAVADAALLGLVRAYGRPAAEGG